MFAYINMECVVLFHEEQRSRCYQYFLHTKKIIGEAEIRKENRAANLNGSTVSTGVTSELILMGQTYTTASRHS